MEYLKKNAEINIEDVEATDPEEDVDVEIEDDEVIEEIDE